MLTWWPCVVYLEEKTMAEYIPVKQLGEGAFGQVWLVEDCALREQRALKIIPPENTSDPTNFYKEAQTLKELEHPNIVTVKDAGRVPSNDPTFPPGHLYIAMEYLPHGSATDNLQNGLFPIRQAVKLICGVCRGLEFAHQRGYVHRDIKPANILIAPDGSGKLSDFGLATRVSFRGAASPEGYLIHVAPEVIQEKRTDVQSDIYALGVTLYRLVNGDVYLGELENLDSETLDRLEQDIIQGKYPNRKRYQPFVPGTLKTAINKALEIDPRKRYRNAQEFRQKLEQVDLKCDWSLHEHGNESRWLARGLRAEFEVVMTKTAARQHIVTLSRRVNGRSQQKISKGCGTFTTKNDLEKHLRDVMGTITRTGKYT